MVWSIITAQPQTIAAPMLVFLPDGPVVCTSWRARLLIVPELVDLAPALTVIVPDEEEL